MNKDFVAGTQRGKCEQMRTARQSERAKMVKRHGPAYDFEVYEHGSLDPKMRSALPLAAALLQPVVLALVHGSSAPSV